MATNELTADQLAAAAVKPASVSVDGRSASAHPLRDLVEMDKHLARKGASKSRRLGLRFLKINPPAPR